MAKKNPERKLTEAIKKAVRETYPGSRIESNPASPYGKAGRPDLIGCVNGWYVEFEVKVPARKHQATEAQLRWLEETRRAGGIAEVIWSVEQAIELCSGLQSRSSLF